MNNLSVFQIVVLGIFSILILVGVGVFAIFGGLLGGSSVGPVVIWGTTDQDAVNKVIDTLRISDKSFEQVSYVEKDVSTYDEELVSAMASGDAPSLFLLAHESLLLFEDKVLAIPYRSVSQAAFYNSFINESQILLTPSGSLGLPFIIDPLVMYWNRDLFATAGLPQAPAHWNDFFDLAPKITSLDQRSTVRRSAVALGEWQNVNHAKEILSAIFMQAGDPIIARDAEGTPVSVFGRFPDNSEVNPAAEALRFYTEFANPSKVTYSWNKALPRASEAFSSGDTAVYFGFASEYADILRKNPNLNVGVAVLPQPENSSVQITFGALQALSIPRSAPNPQGALLIAQKMSSAAGVAIISQELRLPPVRRDVPVNTEGNAAASAFVQSSLISRAWLDPNPRASDDLFKTMIESVVSGRQTPSEVVAEVASEFQQLIDL